MEYENCDDLLQYLRNASFKINIMQSKVQSKSAEQKELYISKIRSIYREWKSFTFGVFDMILLDDPEMHSLHCKGFHAVLERIYNQNFPNDTKPSESYLHTMFTLFFHLLYHEIAHAPEDHKNWFVLKNLVKHAISQEKNHLILKKDDLKEKLESSSIKMQALVSFVASEAQNVDVADGLNEKYSESDSQDSVSDDDIKHGMQKQNSICCKQDGALHKQRFEHLYNAIEFYNILSVSRLNDLYCDWKSQMCRALFNQSDDLNQDYAFCKFSLIALASLMYRIDVGEEWNCIGKSLQRRYYASVYWVFLVALKKDINEDMRYCISAEVQNTLDIALSIHVDQNPFCIYLYREEFFKDGSGKNLRKPTYLEIFNANMLGNKEFTKQGVLDVKEDQVFCNTFAFGRRGQSAEEIATVKAGAEHAIARNVEDKFKRDTEWCHSIT